MNSPSKLKLNYKEGDITAHSMLDAFSKFNILLCFLGPFAQGLVSEASHIIKSKIQSKTISMAVFEIFVELAQNIIKHSATVNEDSNTSHLKSPYEIQPYDGMIVIGENKINDETTEIYIQSSNFIASKDKVILEAHLTMMNSLDETALKDLYKKRRKELRSITETKGKKTGLGIITAARRSKKPFEFRFEKVNDEIYFYTLMITL